MKHTESQKEMILAHLLTGSTITAIDGVKYFNCLNVRNRIGELRKEKWNIETTMIRVPSGKMVAQYRLVNKVAP
jgi:hypothetical protein